MKQIITINDLPSSLDALEMMEVKGGLNENGTDHFEGIKVECQVQGSGVSCTAAGSGVRL